MRNTFKRLAAIAGIALIALSFAACSSSNQQSADQQAVNDQQAQYAKVQPIPYFDWSQDRDTLIQIYKAKNEARNTWTVVTSNTGAVVFACESVGFGLAADTQLTNGQQITYVQYKDASGNTKTSDWGVIDMAEPNGLYSSKNTNGTYVLCIRANHKIVPTYSEQLVNVFPFPVTIDANNRIVDSGGDSSITLDLTTKATPAPSATTK